MNRNFAFAAVLLTLLFLGGRLMMRPRSSSPESKAGTGAGEQQARVVAATAADSPANRPVAVAPSAEAGLPAAAPAAAKAGAVTRIRGADGAAMLRIVPGAVLATVNGVPIGLNDLLPFPVGKEPAEHTLSAERYSFLLDRAIDREIVLQQAREQKIELTASQRAQLASLRARGEQQTTGVFDDLRHDPANAEFEARDAAALLLQTALAEKAGVPSRDVTPALVEVHYREHAAEFGALPADPAARASAWERIDQDIRVKLARQAQPLHEEAFQKYLEELRAPARIVKTRAAP